MVKFIPTLHYTPASGRRINVIVFHAGWSEWAAWYRGEGAYRGKARARDARPNVPTRLPRAWRGRLPHFLARRKL